jgi:hypothetical protein
MNRINALNNVEFPASSDSWEFIMTMFENLQNIARIREGNYILTGCVETGGNVSDGYVVVDGEILPFQGGTKTSFVIIEETNQNVLDQGVTYNNVYTTRKVRFGTGAGQIAWSTFERGIDRNYTKQEITAHNTYNIAKTVGIIDINVSADGTTTLNLPVAGLNNRGNTITVKYYINPTYGCSLIINHSGNELYNHSLGDTIEGYLKLKSNGTTWVIMPSNIKASTNFLGLSQRSSQSQFDAGSADPEFFVHPSTLKSRKPFRNYTVKTQDGNAYTIPDTTDVLHINYVDDYQYINFPDATLHKNRKIAVYGLHEMNPLPATNFVYQSDEWNIQSFPLTFQFSCWQSTGQAWVPVAVRTALACPYIYINGIKSGEVLRNLLGEHSKIQEVTDITEFLRIGMNRISIKELKDEISYFESLAYSINGEVHQIEVPESLNEGETIDFTIDVKDVNDKVKIIANGYYQLSDKKIQSLQFGEPGTYDDNKNKIADENGKPIKKDN